MTLRFRAYYHLNAEIALGADPVVLSVGQATVTLSAQEDTRNPIAEVELVRAVSPEVLAGLLDLSAHRAPKGTDRGHPDVVHREEWDGIPLIGHDGSIRDNYALPVGALPARLRTTVTEVSNILTNVARDTTRAIRWRLDAMGSHSPVRSFVRAEWSRDGKAWHALPSDIHARVSARKIPRIEEPAKSQVEAIATAGGGEPLAHALLREANANAHGNPRSSLILAVVALETGTKEYVADLAPSAEWLAFEAPSPALPKMLSEYLPTLESRRERHMPAPVKHARKLIQRAVEARNRVAHRGEHSGWTTDDLYDFLEIVKLTLYQMDYYRGQDWALEYVDVGDR